MSKAKKPERMNAGETAVLIALGMERQGIERRELDRLAENPFVIPSLESRGFIYTHGKIVVPTMKGSGWLEVVAATILKGAIGDD